MLAHRILTTFLYSFCTILLVHSANVSDISFTFSNGCASSTDGEVKCWGNTRYLGIDIGTNRPYSDLFLGDDAEEMGAFLPVLNLGTNRTVKKFAEGFSFLHMCAILENDAIKCWGYSESALGGQSGEIGTPEQMGDALPEVNLGTNRTAVQVAIGSHHTCAILDNGDLKCWGLADNGRIGRSDPSGDGVGNVPVEMGDNLLPVDLGTNRTPVQVACGDKQTCVLLENGQVKCFGYGFHGSLGYGNIDDIGLSPSEMGDALKEVELGTGRSAIQIVVGNRHTCAVLDNHQLKCWGDGSQNGVYRSSVNRVGDKENQMGDNLTTVNLGDGLSVLEVAAGNAHTCALLSNHKLKCFGYGFNGALGRETRDIIGNRPYHMGDNLTFVDVGTGLTVVTVRCAFGLTCVILDNGLVKCWGDNGSGRLGYGDSLQRGAQPGLMGDNLPFVDFGFGVPPPSPSPTFAPTPHPSNFPSVSPSHYPTRSPVTSAQSLSPTTPSLGPSNGLDIGDSVGVAIGTVSAFIVAFMLAYVVYKPNKKSDFDHIVGDSNGLQQDNVRYEQNTTERFAVPVAKQIKEEFPVAKVIPSV